MHVAAREVLAPHATTLPPFLRETQAFFQALCNHDLATLEACCTDDLRVVAVSPDGATACLETPDEWRRWFEALFAHYAQTDTTTGVEVLDYHATRDHRLGYSVVQYYLAFTRNGQEVRHYRMGTFIWQATLGGWKLSRWHSSMLGIEV